MHKEGARSRKILLPPLADIVNTHTERQDFVKEMAKSSYCNISVWILNFENGIWSAPIVDGRSRPRHGQGHALV